MPGTEQGGDVSPKRSVQYFGESRPLFNDCPPADVLNQPAGAWTICPVAG